MLEKLIYKNSWVRDWNFDVTMCREAEDFIRQMASQGYRLKKLTRDYRALFVKDEEIRKKAFCVAVPSDRVKSREDELRAALRERGWEKIAEKDRLEVYQAEIQQEPESASGQLHIPRREHKICFEDVRDRTRFGKEAIFTGVLAAMFTFQGIILQMRGTSMPEQGCTSLSAGDHGWPVICFGLAALLVLELILYVAVSQNLRLRLDIDRKKKPFLPRTIIKVQNGLLLLVVLGEMLFLIANKAVSLRVGIGVMLFLLVFIRIMEEAGLLLPQKLE